LLSLRLSVGALATDRQSAPNPAFEAATRNSGVQLWTAPLIYARGLAALLPPGNEEQFTEATQEKFGTV
jgi:hypothetical protein